MGVGIGSDGLYYWQKSGKYEESGFYFDIWWWYCLGFRGVFKFLNVC